jgi:hypothetical protein
MVATSDTPNENKSVLSDEMQENTIALVRALLMLELSKAPGGLKPSVAAAYKVTSDNKKSPAC